MNSNEELDTQVQDEEVLDATEGGEGTSSDAGDDEFFLTVNDRTKYRTPAEAIKGFQEAQGRIGSLSKLEQAIQQYGLSDPEQIQSILDEYVTLKQTAMAGSKGTEKKGAEAASAAEATHSDDDLSPDDKKALGWLKKMAPRLGFVPKEELQKLQEKFDASQEEFQTSRAADEEVYKNSLIESSRTMLPNLFSGYGMKHTDKAAQVAERAIANWINEDTQLQKRFYAGGAITQKLIEEGFSLFAEGLGFEKKQSAGVNGKANLSSYVRSKQGVINRNGKPMPKPGVRKTSDERGTQGKKLQDFTPETHNKAFEVFQSHIRGGNAEE